MPARTKLTKLFGKPTLQYPGISSPPSFRAFLNTTWSVSENRRAIAVVDKKEVDEAYERALRQRFEPDDLTVSRYLEEICTIESHCVQDLYRTSNCNATT